MMQNSFRYVVFLASTPERVWEALTSSEYTFRYWSERFIESDWKSGSEVLMRKPNGDLEWRGVVGTYLPFKELSYTWQLLGPGEESLEESSQVSFIIDEHGSAVRLTLEHSGFPEPSTTRPLVEQGWPAILSSLKSLLETDEPLRYG